MTFHNRCKSFFQKPKTNAYDEKEMTQRRNNKVELYDFSFCSKKKKKEKKNKRSI